VDEFNDTKISKTVLERLLQESIYFHIKIRNKDTMMTDSSTVLYEKVGFVKLIEFLIVFTE